MYVYRTAVGLLQIIRSTDGVYYFKFGDDPIYWTGHPDPQVVADDVYCHVTGCSAWDDSDINGPCDLSEWDKA